MREDFENYLCLINAVPELKDPEIDLVVKSAFLELCDECSEFNIWCSYSYLNVIKTHELRHDKVPGYCLLITRDHFNNPEKPILISELSYTPIPYGSEYSIPLDKDVLKERILKWFNSMISLIMNKD